MRQIQVNLPDRVAEEAKRTIEQGRFESLDDLVRAALVEYFEKHPKLVLEQQQLGDVEWARKKLAG